jgi:hypothetical protein
MKLGRSVIQRHKVLGTTADLPGLVHSLGIDHVVITMAQASRQDIKRITKSAKTFQSKFGSYQAFMRFWTDASR